MAELLNVHDLARITKSVGIELEVVESIDEANLYALADQDNNCIYVGKAASARRHRDEDRWRAPDFWRHNYSGFVALATANDAVRHAYRYRSDTFAWAEILKTAEHWTGSLIDVVTARARANVPPSTEEVEQILIRIHVRTGCVVGNSQFASQWEHPIGSFTDAVAILAAYNAFEDGILPAPVGPRSPENAVPDTQSINGVVV